MVLYLSSTAHSNLLDFTGWYEADSEMPIKKLVGSYVLKQFVVHDMRNFSHFSEVVLDRLAFGDDDTEFAEAIEEFLTMYNARMTVICEGLQQSDSLFAALLNSGVGNIVCDTEITAMQREISECLSETGMTRYNPKERSKKQHSGVCYHFDCENVHIAVMAAQPRMGATTVAMGLCGWLQSVGATVCYVEGNSSRHLSILARAYQMEQEDDGWLMDSVQYRTTQGKDVNFIVHDLGSDIGTGHKKMAAAHLRLLVGGAKPYEYPYTNQLRKSFEASHAYILCPFVAEDSRVDFAEALQSDYHKVLFTEYQPEPTNGSVQAKAYKTIIAKYIAGA
ncbi:MAG: hypothetical protein RSA86_02255 [Christensenellaceae bacterium]